MRKLIAVLIGAGLLGGLALSQGPTEITFWTTFTGPVDVAALKKIAANFEKDNPDIKVKFVQVTGAEVTDNTKLMTAVAGGTGPDVYMLDRFIVAERAAAGLLEPLDDLIKADNANLKDDYQPFAWAETQFKNQTWALPFDTDTRAMYYRKDILRSAGVDPNQLDPAKGVPKLSAVTEMAMKLNQKDAKGEYTRIGFVPWPDQGWHYTWGFAHNASFYDATNCKVTALDKGVVAGYQFLYDYAKRLGPKQVASFVSTYYPPNFPPAQHPFITGRQPMVITGDWFIAVLKQYGPKAEYGITYIPTPDGHKTTWAGGWSMVIPKGAKHVAEAYKYLRYITGEPGQRVYTKDTSHLPTIKTLMNDKTLYDAGHQFFAQMLPSASSRPPLPVGALLWDQLTTAMQKVTLNQETPQQALKTVETRVNAQLAKFCK